MRVLIFLFLFLPFISFGQEMYIYTKEGKTILLRLPLILNCLKSLNKDRGDKTAVAICECQTDKINRRFTNKQYRKFSDKGVIDLEALVNEDTLLKKSINECYTNSGKTTLLQAEGFENEFISSCIKNIQKNSEKTLELKRVSNFCSCQLDMVKEKKISDSVMKTLGNPNSLLFYEMIYKCGDPFLVEEELVRDWDKSFSKDLKGPLIDTIKVLSLNGMTYVKIKMSDMVQIWLFDTGASDLLINKEMEEKLKNDKIITHSNYLGIGEYEMANGMIDTCRKYLLNNIQIGKFSVDNVVVAVTDKGKRIIVGKALLNKFSKWILNNENNTLILNK